MPASSGLTFRRRRLGTYHNPSQAPPRGGATPPTDLKAFPGPRGRPDPKNTPNKSGQIALRYPVKVMYGEVVFSRLAWARAIGPRYTRLASDRASFALALASVAYTYQRILGYTIEPPGRKPFIFGV